MLYTINELRQKIFEKVYSVYEIFQHFFEPQFTDLQGVATDGLIINLLNDLNLPWVPDNPDTYDISDGQLQTIINTLPDIRPIIYVYWPIVTVSNENNRSVVIKDLYAKIEVTMQGTIPYENRGFQLNRTTFSNVQWANGYLHSHIPGISRDRVPHFDNPCLGSGPIKDTILELKNEYDEVEWMLFCQELSLYVTVESLTGVPFMKLESIGATDILYDYTGFTSENNIHNYHYYHRSIGEERFKTILAEFTRWYLEHGHLKFDYNQERFKCGMSYYDFMVDISNAFISWYNEIGTAEEADRLYASEIFIHARASQGRFYCETSSAPTSTASIEGLPVLNFKGETKLLHIEPPEENSDMAPITLLNHRIAMYLLGRILKIINNRYSNEHNRLPETGSTQEGSSSSYQTVLYL